MKRYLVIIIHIAAWSCLLLLPFVFSPRFRDPNLHYYIEPYIWMLITLNAYLIAFFYTNTEVLIPRLLFKRKWLWYLLIILGCFIVFIQLPRLFDDALRANLPQEVKEKFARRRRPGGISIFNGSTAVFFLVLTISTCMKVMQQWLQAEKRKREVEKDKVETELSFLRTQINPHFLFNTLNNIYSLAVVKSDATAGTVLKLSSIMRYVLHETKNDWVPLENEIKFLNDFIDLQRVRLTDKTTTTFNVETAVENKLIAPLILVPFVENAFKYGISTKERSSIFLSISANEKEIDFKIENDIVSAETSKLENSGIGLKNTRRRLELLYPGLHQLSIRTENNKYYVHLILQK
ncbi:sensor histidine kinase [Aridibaculum aurantiacum]|uniref:sensor histidine kinase n=1 Tax=Aridibaculum aurantiacum TaxID=2810307 RepID=UPI001A961FB5|nr:histidine kinase [Aridibaculum aurantiacum]